MCVGLRVKPFRVRPRDQAGVVVRHVQCEHCRRTVNLILSRNRQSQVGPIGPDETQWQEELQAASIVLRDGSLVVASNATFGC